MKINEITSEDLTVQIHHVGGIGRCGPAESLRFINNFSEWTIYDADKDALESVDVTRHRRYNLIHKCIGGKNGQGTFYTTKTASASSLLKPAKSAKDYRIPKAKTTWGEQTEIVKKEKIKIYTLRSLLKNKEINPIDFLSIDVQGAELDVLNGTDLSDVMGVVCEAEFSQLYEGQPLFFDISKKMHDEGFRFCSIFNPQRMNVNSYPKSFGFLTVGEALFFKEPEKIFDKLETMSIAERTKKVIQLLKLVSIATCFNQTDFAMDILRRLKKLIPIEKTAEESEYVQILLEIFNDTEKNHAPKS